MTDQTIKSSRNLLEEAHIDDQFTFKTASFIQNDLQLSLIYFGLILFSPLLLWNQVDHALLFSWQGGMLAITTARWVCRFATESKISKDNLDGFWSGVLVFLTLLEGLGWGVSGAILFPINSTLTMSLIALLLIGVGGVGAASYSSRMLIAIPYLLCVITPYISRLYFTGGEDSFLIASVLSLVAIMFCFATDRLNITLSSALKSKTTAGEEVKVQHFSENNNQLQNLIESEKKHSKNLEEQLINNSQKLANLHDVMTEYNNELHLLAGRSINLQSDLKSLKNTDLSQEQSNLIYKIEENAQHLTNILNDSNKGQEPQPVKQDANLNSNINEPQSSNQEFYLTESQTIKQTIQASERTLDISSDAQKVLVVGDNKNERETVEACLREIDLSYKSVENVPAALAVLCEAEANDNSFDVVIANMWMPDIDGIGFAETLQNDPEFKGIKFILINSGEMPPENLLKKVGINRVVQKPIQTDDLINIVSALVQEPKTKKLPTSIESVIDEAIQISLNGPENEEENYSSDDLIDQYVIEELRTSTTINFIEAVNDFLEDVPQLIEDAKVACNDRDYSAIKKSIKDLGGRSLHIGAKSLLESARSIEASLEDDQIERVIGKLQVIDAEFIQVESALLAELTNGSLFFNEIKH